MNSILGDEEPASSGHPAVLDIGTKLQRLRRERNWTLHEASRATGISLSALSKIERGELSPTVTTLSRIGAGFNVDVATLLS